MGLLASQVHAQAGVVMNGLACKPWRLRACPGKASVGPRDVRGSVRSRPACPGCVRASARLSCGATHGPD